MLDSIPKSLIRFLDDASIPNSLLRFFDDASITFIGVGVSCGFAKLAGEYDRLPAIPEKKCLELGVMVDKVRDTSHLNRYSNLGLSELVAEILLHGVYVKPEGVNQADWGVEVLTGEQVKYATLDAYIPLAIMNKLSTEGSNFFYLYEEVVMQLA